MSVEAMATYAIERRCRELIAYSDFARRLVARAGPTFLELIVNSLYAYQLQYIFDDARYRGWIKSRQIGGSHGLALAAVLQGLMEAKRDQIIISASQVQADELIAVCAAHIEVLQKITRVQLVAPDAKPNKQKITLVNGSRIFSRPANPRTIRSFHGDIHWDETAITAHDGEIFKAAWAIASRHNYRVSLISTPFGESGIFYDKVRGKGSESWSVHETDIHAAVRAGCPVNVAEVKAGVSDIETWQQEYLCAFLGDAQSYFPFDLLRRVADVGQACLDRLAGDPETGRAPERTVTTYGGIDVGRQRDLTADAWLHCFKDGVGYTNPVETLRGVEFEEQHNHWCGAIRANRPMGVLIDSTGMGMGPAERLERAFPGVVRGYQFTNEKKRAVVEHCRREMEAGKIGIHPADRDTLSEFHTIQRLVGKAGVIRYSAERLTDGRANPDGHADRATAVMLAEFNRAGVADWFFDGAQDARTVKEQHEQYETEWKRAHEAAVAEQTRHPSALAAELERLRGGAAVEDPFAADAGDDPDGVWTDVW